MFGSFQLSKFLRKQNKATPFSNIIKSKNFPHREARYFRIIVLMRQKPSFINYSVPFLLRKPYITLAVVKEVLICCYLFLRHYPFYPFMSLLYIVYQGRNKLS
jgi:hypothetical protein